MPEPECSHTDAPEQSDLGLVEGSVFASLFQLVEDDAGESLDVNEQLLFPPVFPVVGFLFHSIAL